MLATRVSSLRTPTQARSKAGAMAATKRGAGDSGSMHRRALLCLAPLLAASAADAEPVPFLKSTGARGILAEEEEALFAARQEAEARARQELDRERQLFEQEARENQRGLCATPFGIDVVGITELIALVGALVGGVAARQRKLEAERLNEQLRKINMQLRQQARAGTIYAPGLSYAPSSPSSTATLTVPMSRPGAEGAAAPAAATAVAAPERAPLNSMDEEISPEQAKCRDTMREGKRLLRSNQGAAALVRFEKALLMSQKLGDKVLQRRALRGMAASSRMQGNLKVAIKHLEAVLKLSDEIQEYTGDADAYGSIADIFTDLGEFENAATYYDKYINKMQEDGQTV